MNEPMFTILLADDNEDDLFALRRALKKAGVTNPQQVLTDGQQVIDYLAGAGRFSDRMQFPLPILIFLDLKMPLRGGFDVLEWIREQPTLDSVTVIILTGSDEPSDHHRARSLGARYYWVKPPQPADLRALIEALDYKVITKTTGLVVETNSAPIPTTSRL